MQGPGQGRGQVCGWAQWERGCSASTSLWLQLDFRFLMGPGNVLTPDVEIPGVPDRRARGVRRVLVVCSGPLQRPRHAAHGHGSAPPMRRSVAVVIADTHICPFL